MKRHTLLATLCFAVSATAQNYPPEIPFDSVPNFLKPPADVHFGRAEQRRAHRALVLEAAQCARPERFVRGTPVPPPLPTAAWINKPKAADGSVISRA